ncbi:MAG: hypothetical protein Q9196_000033 [Gyalolechia fulgens]
MQLPGPYLDRSHAHPPQQGYIQPLPQSQQQYQYEYQYSYPPQSGSQYQSKSEFPFKSHLDPQLQPRFQNPNQPQPDPKSGPPFDYQDQRQSDLQFQCQLKYQVAAQIQSPFQLEPGSQFQPLFQFQFPPPSQALVLTQFRLQGHLPQPFDMEPSSSSTQGDAQPSKTRLTMEQRRQNHIRSECQRRDDLKAAFTEMTRCVPSLNEDSVRNEGYCLLKFMEYSKEQLEKRDRLIKELAARGIDVEKVLQVPVSMVSGC